MRRGTDFSPLAARFAAAVMGFAMAVTAIAWHGSEPGYAPDGPDSGGEGSLSGGDESDSAGCAVTFGLGGTASLTPEPRHNEGLNGFQCIGPSDIAFFTEEDGGRASFAAQNTGRLATLDSGVIARDLLACANPSCTPVAVSQGAEQFDPMLLILDVFGDDQVVFANFLTGAFEATIDLAQGLPFLTSPQAMATTPDGARLIVTNLGGSFEDLFTPPHITIIDVAARSIEGRVILPNNFGVSEVVTSPDGLLAYVAAAEQPPDDPRASFDDPRVLVIDLGRREIVDEIALPNSSMRTPNDLALTPDGNLLFVAESVNEEGRPRIFAIDTRTRTVSATVTPPRAQGVGDLVVNRPSRFAMHPDGSRLYVAPLGLLATPTVVLAEVDTSTLEFGRQIELTGVENVIRTNLTVSANGRDIYFNDVNGGRLIRIDTVRRHILTVGEVGIGSLGPIVTLTAPRGSLTGLR